MDGNGNVVKSLDWNRNGATKGNNVGSQINGNWTLNNNDQQSIQNQINSTLSNSGYYLNLSNDQAAQIAQATFGGSVYLYANSNVIASQALRINLYSQSGRYIGYTDFTRSGATNGTNVGNYSNGTWNISDADANTILNQINNVLSANGYQTVGNTLTTAQRAQIAQGVFGSSISLTGYGQTQNNYSTVNLMGNSNGTDEQMKFAATKSATNGALNNGTAVQIENADPSITYNIGPNATDTKSVHYSDLYKNVTVDGATTQDALTNAIKTTANGNDAKKITQWNEDARESADSNTLQYATTSNTAPNLNGLSTGSSYVQFAPSDVQNYLSGRSLTNLQSPVYPHIYFKDGNAQQPIIAWYQNVYAYNYSRQGNAYNGQTVNAYYDTSVQDLTGTKPNPVKNLSDDPTVDPFTAAK